MVFARWRTFGRSIVNLYERRPVLMNGIVGFSVYGIAEAIAQLQSQSAKLDARRICPISALGALEVGPVMVVWYRALDKYIGMGGASFVVLAKCAADQLFFATQGDGLFLMLCASLEKEDLPRAIHEVKRVFLTTWLNDCAVWPLVNSLGFWVVPTTLLPTYMAAMQLFWQLYLSVSQQPDAPPSFVSDSVLEVDNALIEQIFTEFDTDGSGGIDAAELCGVLRRNGITVSADGIQEMMRFGDVDGNRLVDRAELKRIIMQDSHSSKANQDVHGGEALWAQAIARTRQLAIQKSGIKGAIARLENFEMLKKRSQGASLADTSSDAVWVEFTTPFPESEKDDDWLDERAEALRNASIGLSILTGCIIVRRLIFKV